MPPTFFRVFCCLIPAALGVAPPAAVLPPPVQRQPLPSTVARVPGLRGGQVGSPVGSREATVRGQGFARVPPAVSMGGQWAEVKLVEALGSASPDMYKEAEALRLPRVSNGEPSIGALVDLLGALGTPPATLSTGSLVGEYELLYTNDLSPEVREQVAKRMQDPSVGLSVTLSINDDGVMDTRSFVSESGGETAVLAQHGLLEQNGQSSAFAISHDGKSESVEVSYVSRDLLVLRTSSEVDDNLDSILYSNDVSQLPARKTYVWKKISAETVYINGPASFWRFGLPSTSLRLDHAQAPLASASAAEESWGLLKNVSMLMAAFTTGLAGMYWWLSFASKRGSLKDSRMASSLEMNSLERPMMEPPKFAPWFPASQKFAVAALGGEAAGAVECVGIVGSSGAVGQEMLKCLETRKFPTKKVRLFAKRSAGTVVPSSFGDITVEPFTVEAAQECEVVLMAVSGDFSKEFAPQIKGGPKNTVVIDNSSAWRMDKDVPLVVPEINGANFTDASLVANPNCTTAIGAMALWPLHQKYGLKKVLMSTYQAASGAGAEGMAELEDGLKAYAKDGEVSKPEFFAHQLPFNVIPHIDAFQENGYTKEEMKVTWELQKIFGLPDSVKVACTAVRVPTLRAHSESITIETEKPIDPAEARELLKGAEGVKVVDDTANLKYPMPLNATGNYDVEVGRIRQSLIFGENGLEFFVSGDQLLRGAALNAVIIAEKAVAAR